MRTYISGQTSGLELDQAKQKFQEAEELLHSINLRPVNPIKLGLRCTDSLNDQIARDVKLLLSCKAIFMLSNWRESKESRIERKVAHETNKIILFERNESKHYDLIQTVEGAIHEVTGQLLKDYNKRSRDRLSYYSRLIFTYQCIAYSDIQYPELSKLINRDRSTFYLYKQSYHEEFKFNCEFREFAEKVDSIMNERKDLIKCIRVITEEGIKDKGVSTITINKKGEQKL